MFEVCKSERMSKKMEIYETIILLTGLIVASLLDIWKKQISVTITVLMGLSEIVIKIVNHNIQVSSMLSLIPGILCLVYAWLSHEQIGYGDGLLLLAVGCYLDLSDMIGLCTLALSITGIYALIMLLIMKKDKKYEIPFAPFLLTGFCIGRWLIL